MATSKTISRAVKTAPQKFADSIGTTIPVPENGTASAPTILKITPPNLGLARFNIRGISPYVQHAFSAKQQRIMEATQRAGQQSRGKKVRQPKDFEQLYKDAMHISTEGWCGIPAPSFRNAIIDSCRLVGFRMTHAKLSVFVVADGTDAEDGSQLVKIIGEPEPYKAPVRNDSGVADIRWRPMWKEWSAVVVIQWDRDQFAEADLLHLMMRAGLQVGIGEGRPNSPNSNGLGFGRFEVITDALMEMETRA